MASANRGNGNNVAIVNSGGNANNNNAINGNRSAPDCAENDSQAATRSAAEVGSPGTRSLPSAGLTREQCGGDGCGHGAGQPTSAPDPEDAIGFDALWESMQVCRRGVCWKASVQSFCLNGLENVARLSDELKSGTYRPRPVTEFTVTSPKVRTITSTAFRDRVYQRSLNDRVLYPLVTRSLIHDNAASQEGKGTDFARERFKCHLQRHYRKHGLSGYVLSVDIRHYYQSLPHWVGEAVFDCVPEWARARAVDVLRGQYSGDVGYNPGSQMVQLVGIAALSPLDHVIKDCLGVKGYVRYMDDLRIIGHSEEWLESVLQVIRHELDKIGLEVHPDKTHIKPIGEKIPFLGFDFRLTGTGKVVMTIKGASVKRMRRRMSRLIRLESMGLRPEGTAETAYRSWRAHASKGNSHRLLRRCDRYIKDKRRQYARYSDCG